MIDCKKCPAMGKCCTCCVEFTNEFIEKHKDKVQADIVETLLIKDRPTTSVAVTTMKISDHKEAYVPITKDDLCIFLDRKTMLCLVQDDKPKICVDYGYVLKPGMVCRYFKPDGTKWKSVV